MYDDGVHFFTYKFDVYSNTSRSTYFFSSPTLLVDVTRWRHEASPVLSTPGSVFPEVYLHAQKIISNYCSPLSNE